jgi:hypothetical protein
MLSSQQDPEGVDERKGGQAWLRLEKKLGGHRLANTVHTSLRALSVGKNPVGLADVL